jgi:hypothetical protein
MNGLHDGAHCPTGSGPIETQVMPAPQLIAVSGLHLDSIVGSHPLLKHE